MTQSSWVELSHILASPTSLPQYFGGLNPPPSAVSALSFDNSCDLVFSGNAAGGTQSWLGPGLSKYTSWKASVRPTVQKPEGSVSSASSTTAGRQLESSWKKSNGTVQAAQHRNVAGGSNEIREICNDGGLVWSVSSRGVHCANRRGLARWSKDTAAMQHPSLSLSSACFSPIQSSSDLIICGSAHAAADRQILSLNRTVGSIVREVSAEGPISQVRKSQRFLLSSTPEGHIQCRDPRSLNIEHRLHAHPGGVVDFKAEGSLVWSVGLTMRLGHPVPEPLIKVHDLRNLRALVPVPFAAPGGPALLDIHPRMSSTVIVAAPQGSWQIVDMNNPGEASFFHLPTNSILTSLCMAPSAEYVAFGEADGGLRLWSSDNTAMQLSHPDTLTAAPKFNTFNTSPPDFPDAPDLSLRKVDWMTDAPLSTVGMPFYDEPLSSNFPLEHFASPCSPLFNPTIKPDASILSSTRQLDGVHFAPLPRHLRGRRNVTMTNGQSYPPIPGRANAFGAREAGKPLFRSEREKERIKKNKSGLDDLGLTDVDPSEANVAENRKESSKGWDVPAHWRKKDIVYSKFGVEDFDFEAYNATQFSGLETHIPNCYLNALLQALAHVSPLTSLAEIHALSGGKARCERDECLLCELGFLYKMLRDAEGINCQATNFLRAFAKSGRATSLGLLDGDLTSTADGAYAAMVQAANRFILDDLAASWAESSVVAWPEHEKLKSFLQDVFLPTVKTQQTCLSCHHVSTRESKGLVVDLVYPRKPFVHEQAVKHDFGSILANSLMRETSGKGSCRFCGNANASLHSRRYPPPTDQMPQVLSINANVSNVEQMELWTHGWSTKASGRSKMTGPTAASASRFLPSKISIHDSSSTGGSLSVTEVSHTQPAPPGSAVYELKSAVLQVQGPKEPSHLVSVIKTTSKSPSPQSKWFLFNDFLVCPIEEDEALSFTTPVWKIPAIIFYERIDRDNVTAPISRIPWSVDSAMLTEDTNSSLNRDSRLIRHQVIEPSGLPQQGDLVSIDAEFVALNPEELEMSSDGSRSTIRPVTMSLARVSVLHGQGESEGKAFIDDHIATQERVFDYLTQFSGIIDGDLDPERSRHTVVPRKLAYKKLRLLVDRGCIFIGHGLRKDFRIINIFVPAQQVIDTVDLFSSTTQARKLSLRFLSWFLLKEAIQGDRPVRDHVEGEEADSVVSGHDSIEDARAALHLYRIYETFKTSGRLRDVMEDLYEEGKRLNWRPPPAIANGG